MTEELKDKRFDAWERLATAAVEAAPKVTTMAMNYDLGHETLRDLYDPMCDYVRYRELELLSEMIRMRNVPGAVAEAGVDMGQTSAVLSRLFPDRELFLYDTFEGFPEEAVDIEVSRFAFDREKANTWKLVRPSSDLIINRVRQGLFPRSGHTSDKVFFRPLPKKIGICSLLLCFWTWICINPCWTAFCFSILAWRRKLILCCTIITPANLRGRDGRSLMRRNNWARLPLFLCRIRAVLS